MIDKRTGRFLRSGLGNNFLSIGIKLIVIECMSYSATHNVRFVQAILGALRDRSLSMPNDIVLPIVKATINIQGSTTPVPSAAIAGPGQ